MSDLTPGLTPPQPTVLPVLLSPKVMHSVLRHVLHRMVHYTATWCITQCITCIASLPKVRLIKDFVSAAEAEHVMKVGLPLMHRSLAGGRTESIRTSTTAMLPARDPVVRAITERAAHLSGYPYGNIEPLQLVQYTPGQKCAPRRTLTTVEAAALTTAEAVVAPRSPDYSPMQQRPRPHVCAGTSRTLTTAKRATSRRTCATATGT